MFSQIGPTEILIIAAVLLILFGSRQLPKFARGMGESQKELKKASKELKEAITEEV